MSTLLFFLLLLLSAAAAKSICSRVLRRETSERETNSTRFSMHFTVIVGLFFAFGTGDSSSSTASQTPPPTSLQSDASAAATALLAVQKPQLQHVALLFRHTVRAPRVFPPNDSLLRPDLFPRGVERSTRQGLLATRNATLVWREWYKDFLKGESTMERVSTSNSNTSNQGENP